MDRRTFFKFLGVGAATAVVAPEVLAEKTPEVYPESNGGQITLKMLQDAYGKTLLNFPKPPDMMFGTPLNMEPFRPSPSGCVYLYVAEGPTIPAEYLGPLQRIKHG